MPANYVTMWGMLILMALGALCEIDFHGFSLRAAYPNDLAKRDALHRCGEMDPAFSRFSAGDRDTCYRAVLSASGRVASKPGAGW